LSTPPNLCPTCGRTPAADSPLGICPACFLLGLEDGLEAPGDALTLGTEFGNIDRFLLEKEISRGGMGQVWRAFDRNLGRWVALKSLHLEEAAQLIHRQRFLQEARILARLEHPNIPPIQTVGLTDDGIPFYTMKLVDGMDLQTVLDGLAAGDPSMQAKYPLDVLLGILDKVGQAVGFAHSQGVIHRDLKPRNIMVGAFGEVLLLDWGVAKVLDPTAPQATQQASANPPGESLTSMDCTSHGSVVGTWGYMAPEQALEVDDEINPRTDIFALGGILYSLLTLRPPYAPVQTLGGLDLRKRAMASLDLVHLSSEARGHLPRKRIPAALRQITTKALSIATEERYASVERFLKDIEAYRGHRPIAAHQKSFGRQLALFIRRHRNAVVLTSLSLLLGLGFGIYRSIPPKPLQLPLTGRVATSDGKPVAGYPIALEASRLLFTQEIPADLPPAHVADVKALDFPVTSGAIFNTIWPHHPIHQIAALFTCTVQVEHSGHYFFELESDDGAQLSIDGNPAVSNDGMHGLQSTSSLVFLEGGEHGSKPGRHEFRVAYFQRIGPTALRLNWSKQAGPGLFPPTPVGGIIDGVAEASRWHARFYIISNESRTTVTREDGSFALNPVSRLQQFTLTAGLPGDLVSPKRHTNDGTAQRDFILQSSPPRLQVQGNVQMAADTTVTLALAVSDYQSASWALRLSIRSSNPSLLPLDESHIGGVGGNRTVRLQPASGQTGSSTVTLILEDQEGLSASTSFVVTVNPRSDP